MAHDHHRSVPPPSSSTTAADRRKEWRSAAALLPYVWEFRGRVALALVLLVSAKLANVGVPLILKDVIDSLDSKTAMLAVPLALLAAYGVLRFSTTLFAELRDVVFVRVTQRAARRIALSVFRHLHSLSLRFHLDRQTGGMTRDIERGTRAVHSLVSFSLYSIIPTLIEVGLVLTLLTVKFDVWFAGITVIALALYITDQMKRRLANLFD